MDQSQELIRVENLQVHFPVMRGFIFNKQIATVKGVDGLNFTIRAGETLGLVGESGSGKSTTGKAILQLPRPTSGKVFFDSVDLTTLAGEELRNMRKRMQIILQNPDTALNPRMTIATLLGEPLEIHGMVSGKEKLDRIKYLLQKVGLNPKFINRFPHQFSGGQRQRIAIARALAVKPEFIVCDEPISALDVSVQAQVINLMQTLQEEQGLTYLFIAHDLSIVRHISHRIAVMYLGKIVELADRKSLYENPRHPYTQALLSAVPIPNPELERNRQPIILKGDPPSPTNPPVGCRFHTRCPYAIEQCRKEPEPEFREITQGHYVACHLAK